MSRYVRGLPFLFSYFLFHRSRVRTLLTRTRGFPWTPCMGPRYFRLFHMEISIHGPALHLNLFLHGPALYPNLLHTDPRVRVISGLFSGFYPWKLQANPYKPTIVNLFILRVLSFQDMGFQAWT